MSRLLLVIALVLVAALGGCWPGQEGWYCDTDSDCSGGRTCKSMETSGGAETKVCVAPDQTTYSGKPTGWPIFIGGLAGLVGGPLLVGVVMLRKRARDRREAAELAARPRIPRPEGPTPACPDPTCQQWRAQGFPIKPPTWQELSGTWWCPRCRAELRPPA